MRASYPLVAPQVTSRPPFRSDTIEPGHVAGVPCDLVILSAGFTPNVELAAEAGVEIGRSGAIRVDDRTETNLRGVYAAGDCAETMNLVTGCPAYVPLGTTANKMGRVAGANAAGARDNAGHAEPQAVCALEADDLRRQARRHLGNAAQFEARVRPVDAPQRAKLFHLGDESAQILIHVVTPQRTCLRQRD